MNKKISILLIMVLVLNVLTACGSSSDSAAATTTDSTNTEVRHVIAGVGNAWPPFDYVDEEGNAVGYEVAVLQAIDELLPELEIEIQSLDWANVVVSLDSGKTDIAAHTLTLNEEREEKYGHTDEIYYNYVVRLMVSKDNNDINSLEDLAGRNVFGDATGEASTQAIEAYNEANPDKAVNLIYAQYTTEQVVAAIDNGSLEAWFGTASILEELNSNYGDKLKFTGDPILQENSVFLINKEDTELKELMDGALKTLRENGTLSELSIEYLGEDFTKAE